jgi:hypothetical protein
MNKDIMSKAFVLSIIFLFIGIGFTSVTAIKPNIPEKKENPIVNSSSVEVYYNCVLKTDDGYPPGHAFLFPGYIRATYGVTTVLFSSGIIISGGESREWNPRVIVDENNYYGDDWDFMIVSGYSGEYYLAWNPIDIYVFSLSGHANKVMVFNF